MTTAKRRERERERERRRAKSRATSRQLFLRDTPIRSTAGCNQLEPRTPPSSPLFRAICRFVLTRTRTSSKRSRVLRRRAQVARRAPAILRERQRCHRALFIASSPTPEAVCLPAFDRTSGRLPAPFTSRSAIFCVAPCDQQASAIYALAPDERDAKRQTGSRFPVHDTDYLARSLSRPFARSFVLIWKGHARRGSRNNECALSALVEHTENSRERE